MIGKLNEMKRKRENDFLELLLEVMYRCEKKGHDYENMTIVDLYKEEMKNERRTI